MRKVAFIATMQDLTLNLLSLQFERSVDSLPSEKKLISSDRSTNKDNVLVLRNRFRKFALSACAQVTFLATVLKETRFVTNRILHNINSVSAPHDPMNFSDEEFDL